MLPVEHVAVGAAALITAKLAVLDRRAPFLLFPTSAVLFGVFAFGSLNLTVVRATDTGVVEHTLREPWGVWAGAAGSLLMLSLLVLDALDRLPDPRIRDGVDRRGADVGGSGPGGRAPADTGGDGRTGRKTTNDDSTTL